MSSSGRSGRGSSKARAGIPACARGTVGADDGAADDGAEVAARGTVDELVVTADADISGRAAQAASAAAGTDPEVEGAAVVVPGDSVAARGDPLAGALAAAAAGLAATLEVGATTVAFETLFTAAAAVAAVAIPTVSGFVGLRGGVLSAASAPALGVATVAEGLADAVPDAALGSPVGREPAGASAEVGEEVSAGDHTAPADVPAADAPPLNPTPPLEAPVFDAGREGTDVGAVRSALCPPAEAARAVAGTGVAGEAAPLRAVVASPAELAAGVAVDRVGSEGISSTS
jgi:hypothetical protein